MPWWAWLLTGIVIGIVGLGALVVGSLAISIPATLDALFPPKERK